MFSVAVVALSLVLTSCVSATSAPRDTQPEGWLAEYFEASISPQTADNADIHHQPYDLYHTRYLALSCKTKRETEFFDQCCHPLLVSILYQIYFIFAYRYLDCGEAFEPSSRVRSCQFRCKRYPI